MERVEETQEKRGQVRRRREARGVRACALQGAVRTVLLEPKRLPTLLPTCHLFGCVPI